MYLRERLASHLYRSALALDPVPVIVARLGHAQGVTWTLDNGSFTFRIGTGAAQLLAANGSVQDLLDDLAPFGIYATFTAPDLLAVLSAALLEGNGSSASAETDALKVFSSTLWTLLDAYGSELSDADANLVAALEQLYMDTADGEILDVWGGYFGVVRGEDSDDDYYDHIVREVLRPRVNRYAIEQAVLDDTGFQVSLREPHREIFRLSVSPLSGDHHLQDGHFYTWNVFQPIYHSPMTVTERDRVLAIIDRNRPAGCMIVGADVQPPTTYVVGHFGQSTDSSINLNDCLGNLSFQPGLLSATLFLSNYRDRPNSAFNWSTSGTVIVGTVVDGSLGIFAQRAWTGNWDGSLWNRPSVLGVVTQNQV